MDKMHFETPDLTQTNIEKIAALFPNCVTETIGPDGKPKCAINFDLLRQMLSDEVIDGDEAYEFTWVGKKAAIVEANRPIRKTLRPCRSESKDWDNTENLYIEGDNLEVLKLLQESYLGQVKMIYIDPPYNTGNDFIYRDDFDQGAEEYSEEIGQLDEEDNRLFRNTDSNGRFHSDWCSMIYSRLMLARNLLSEDGVIFISINDVEIQNLRRICDEIFGSSNFIAQLIWRSRQNKDNRNLSGVSIDHEYILCYVKQFSKRVFCGTERKIAQYSNPDNDPRGPWTSANMVGLATADVRPNLHYDLVNPANGINYGCPIKGWRYDKNTMKRLILEKRIIWPSDSKGRPRKKSFLGELADNLPGFSSLIPDGIYTNTATKEIMALFEGKPYFDFPKPIEIIKLLTEQITQSEDIVLDFFSGSATTAHAVMQLNAEDGGHRKFIMVQLDEPCDEKSEAYKAGYKNICEIGKERIRRAGEKIKSESPLTTADLDTGFRVFKLAGSNMKDVYYAPGEITQQSLSDMVSNIREDRTDLDLLFGCLLEWGLPLSMPYTSEQLEGCTVHTYNEGDLIACFDKNVPETVVKEIAKRKPLRAVFRDSSFADSPAKINVFEIFKLYAPDTRVKVI